MMGFEQRGTKSSDVKAMVVRFVDEDWDNKVCWDVSGDGQFGLEFTPWDEWKGMEISSDALGQFAVSEIAAHCLEEMTVAGFSQQDIDQSIEGKGFIRKDDPWAWWKMLLWRIRMRFGRCISEEEIFASQRDDEG